MADNSDADKEAVHKLPIPVISRELVKWMRLTNPVRPIAPSESKASANRKAGVQDLIDKLDWLSQMQAKGEAGELDPDEMEALVFEAPTAQQEADGYVLRVS